MRPTRRSYALRVAVVVGAVLMSGWGTSSASTDSAAAPASPDGATQAAAETTVVRYGPYDIDAAPDNPDGSHGHIHSGNQFAFNVEKPCDNCYITELEPDLVKADGTRAGFSNGLQLHHMVLFNQETGRTDATCPSGLGLLGQRFFASGDERSVIEFPEGYGYHLGSGARWNLIWDLASTSTVPETVYYQVTYTWVPDSTPGMTDVEPVWLDADQCGDSQISVPAGQSSHDWTWTVNRPGDLVSIGGHLHDHGVNLEITNDSTGELICDSVAGYGEEPLYIDHHGEEHISSMSGCVEDPVASMSEGQQVTITGHYDAPEATDDAMVISVAYIAEPGSGGGGSGGDEDCVTAANSAHVEAGRATSWLVFAWAVGSDDYLGLTSASTSLQQASSDTWTRVASCS